MAYDSGKVLKQLFISKGIQTVIIETSPFLRCMMTAAHIKRGLQSDIDSQKFEVKEIKRNYLMSEYLSNMLFEEGNPIGKLNSETKS